MRKQRATLSGSETAYAALRASSSQSAAGGTSTRGAGDWREAVSLQGRLKQGQLIAPEVSMASPNQQAALV
jgi:hypothetical protein